LPVDTTHKNKTITAGSVNGLYVRGKTDSDSRVTFKNLKIWAGA
jgi:hypothetical protein